MKGLSSLINLEHADELRAKLQTKLGSATAKVKDKVQHVQEVDANTNPLKQLVNHLSTILTMENLTADPAALAKSIKGELKSTASQGAELLTPSQGAGPKV